MPRAGFGKGEQPWGLHAGMTEPCAARAAVQLWFLPVLLMCFTLLARWVQGLYGEVTGAVLWVKNSTLAVHILEGDGAYGPLSSVP